MGASFVFSRKECALKAMRAEQMVYVFGDLLATWFALTRKQIPEEALSFDSLAIPNAWCGMMLLGHWVPTCSLLAQVISRLSCVFAGLPFFGLPCFHLTNKS